MHTWWACFSAQAVSLYQINCLWEFVEHLARGIPRHFVFHFSKIMHFLAASRLGQHRQSKVSDTVHLHCSQLMLNHLGTNGADCGFECFCHIVWKWSWCIQCLMLPVAHLSHPMLVPEVYCSWLAIDDHVDHMLGFSRTCAWWVRLWLWFGKICHY